MSPLGIAVSPMVQDPVMVVVELFRKLSLGLGLGR